MRGDRRARQNKYSGQRLGPSQLKTNLEIKHQYRFTSTAATSTSITDTLLLSAAGVVASTAVLGKSIFQAVKINQIEIFTPPASQGASATCSILFPPSAAANYAMPREITDTTVSVSEPAHVLTSPPPNSAASFWNGPSGANLFTLVAPTGSIIDVWLSLVLADGPADYNLPTATLVGASVGATYFCSLDSSTKAGSIYQAVGLTSV